MLELKNLTFTVEENGSEKTILRDLNLTIDNSKFVVITGPNGSGKSTLAKLIMGIEKPTSGQIFFDGEDITDLSITERARLGVSFAFQQPVRFKGIRVHDLLRLASGKDISITEACNYLSEVGLCARDYINREINASLSGGELKRIEIATLLARQTKLSVFDEPEAGIDLWSFQNQGQLHRHHLTSGAHPAHRRRDHSALRRHHQEAGQRRGHPARVDRHIRGGGRLRKTEIRGRAVC